MPPLLIITMTDFRIFLSAMERVIQSGLTFSYRNNGNSNGWLKVVLRGTQSNRSGIGAKIRLTAGGQTQFREYTGQHYMGQNHIPIHFGLGQATIVDSLTITVAKRDYANIA